MVCSKEENREYLLFSLKDFFYFSTGTKTGNTFANMNKGDFGDIKLIEPDSQILNFYHTIVSPMFERSLNNSIENKELKRLRDWLLPMLMNGQVKVSE